jgi:hypothetical protein
MGCDCPKFNSCNSGYCPLSNSGKHCRGDSVCSMVTKFAKELEIPDVIHQAILSLKARLMNGESVGLDSEYKRYLFKA